MRLVWAAAEPCNPSTMPTSVLPRRSAKASRVGELDAIHLDLHGALVVESFEDGGGGLLRRVRALVGPKLPVSVSLDMHANVTEAMVELSDGITVYWTYPHVAMVETGQRAFDS
ncbi:M81 family metallopeptidase [Mesorhizobium sp. M0208]